jgi:hypothetical protein
MMALQPTRSLFCGQHSSFDYASHYEKFAFKSTSSSTGHGDKVCTFAPGQACWLPMSSFDKPNNTDAFAVLLCDVVAIMPTVGGSMVLLIARETGVHQPPPSEWKYHSYGSTDPSILLWAYEAKLIPFRHAISGMLVI